MFNFLCNTVVLHGRRQTLSAAVQNYQTLMLSLRVRCMSTTSNFQPFTLSYLIGTCGLSKESALNASKFVRFETPDKPDSVVAFFKTQGFTKAQITRIIKTRPPVLLFDIEKTLLPKVEFFLSRGVSSSDLAKVSAAYPTLLMTSLDRQIIPVFNFISNLLESDEKTFLAIKRLPRVISYDVEAFAPPNIDILRSYGVPQSNIVAMFGLKPQILLKPPAQFKDVVETVKKMGFNPTNMSFLQAIFVLTSLAGSTWGKKFDLYKKWNLSEEEIYKAFRNQPFCMISSEEKINTIMHFIVNEMGFQPSVVSKNPRVLMTSFRKRILPRALFARDLLSKGVIKCFRLRPLFLTSEKAFIERFISGRNEAEASELLKLYQEKLELSSNWKAGMKASV